MADASVPPIPVSINEPSGKAWSKETLQTLRAISGVVSVTVDPATPDVVVCLVPGEPGLTKPVINVIAYTLPGVPLHWSSATPAQA